MGRKKFSFEDHPYGKVEEFKRRHVLCFCGCGESFFQKRRDQLYVNGDHRERDRERRWPRKRTASVAAITRIGQCGAQEAKISDGPSLGQGFLPKCAKDLKFWRLARKVETRLDSQQAPKSRNLCCIRVHRWPKLKGNIVERRMDAGRVRSF